MITSPNRRIALIAFAIFALDQLTKQVVLRFLALGDEHVLVDGFFKLVYWSNTGAAWSMFHNRNEALAIVSLIALLGLFIWRHHFDTKTALGQISMGLIFGGIIGNLADRLVVRHVIDFLRFYIYKRNGEEIGFPAFNVADSAICVGVFLLFILSWRETESRPSAQQSQA
ncbi:MAG: lspA [Verrucomicrobiales bacterium]|nr:lspA [Verrucomicrobiales bacterium]